jgi:LDH2 family malate/lactate/ureidoglycolate dehydrogenase
MLRGFVVDLLTAAGVAGPRASDLARHLLWYETAGAPAHGLAALAGWLDQIAAGQVDPAAEGQVIRPEFAATAIVDGHRGLAPLVLAQAAAIARDKAREVGLAMVRVQNAGGTCPGAEVAAEIAVGPYIAVVLGENARCALALPSPEGLPVVYDPDLAPGGHVGSLSLHGLAPWIEPLAPGGGWIVLVAAVAAIEGLTGFHERVAEALQKARDSADPALLLPGRWEPLRTAAREHGLAVSAPTLDALRAHAGRRGVSPIP